jgi:Mn-dependent DtxR family transcriptional regulator
MLTLAAARSTDPATAHEAARTTRANKITELVYQDLKSNGNASAATVAKRLGIALNTVSPRFATLKKQGRVIVVGGERGEGAAKRSVYGAI